MFSGMSPGSTSISISRLTKSTMPPCCLTPLASPLSTIGTVTRQHLVHRDLVEVGVEQLVVDRIELVLLDQHARVAAVEPSSPISVFTPDSECRMRDSTFGSTEISTALPFSTP